MIQLVMLRHALRLELSSLLLSRLRQITCVLIPCIWLTAPALSQPKEPETPSSRFSTWSETGFDRADTRLLRFDEIYGKRAPAQDHHLALTAVYLQGTSWSEARVLRHIRRTARILEPCGIELIGVRLVKAWIPRELRSIDTTDKIPGTEVPQSVYRLSSYLPKSAEWPVVFFVGRIDGEEVLARSYQQGDVPAGELKDYPYMNSAWISYRAHWVERPEDEYSVLAHELAHLLCRCGHERGAQRHLLHEYRNFLGSHVLTQHCEMFRSSNMVTSPPPRRSK